ncbi:MAG: tRNA (guanosine(37)-N1)-methyltransferase TrmD [Calditrichaeota bacterium]|nr:tRNA (guanosine(37)-N1)-methyltransferase TrmD [Actinomycetota bacterium]NOY57566.1 tRNA (guanosine(37)-N1)-methyltransferase TrmD [Calditrichota bacterium]
MEIHVITAFPKVFQGPLSESILKRAQSAGIVEIHLHDIRDYARDKHKQIDDYPYGGGAGMILKPEPLFRCIEDVYEKYDLGDTPLTLMSATGETYNQKKAVEISLRDKLVLLSGHYKGIDERVIEKLVDEEISIGDYILTGGEIPAVVIIDSVVRILPGAIGDIDSAINDSFQTGLLDHPHYTRPENFRSMTVPKVLLSGNHAEIEKWRRLKALERTKERRKDLYLKYIESEN